MRERRGWANIIESTGVSRVGLDRPVADARVAEDVIDSHGVTQRTVYLCF